MKSNCDPAAKGGPHSSSRRHSGGLPVSEVFGFPVVNNQFNVLQSNQTAESPSQAQRKEGLMDPRSTRLARQAAQRTEDQGIVVDGGVPATITVLRNAQGNFTSGDNVDPVAFETCSQIVSHSLPACPPDILKSKWWECTLFAEIWCSG